MNLKFVYYVLLLCSASLVDAQQLRNTKLLNRAQYDSEYVDSYYDKYLHVTLVSTTQNLTLDVNNSANKSTVTFKPNNALRFGIGLDYNIFSLEFTQSIDAIDAPKPELGKTQSTGLRLGITGRRLLVSLIGQQYKSLYISNAADLMQSGIAVPHKVRPDLESGIILGSINYFFNHHKYSTMASLWQIDKQKKSAGSAIVGLTYSVTHISGDSSILPSFASSNNNEKVIDSYNYLLGINCGYAYNFTFRKKWFVNMMAVPGINMQNGHNINEARIRTGYSYKFGYHADLRLIGGYNGERNYFGVHLANFYLSNTIKDQVDVNLSNTYFRIFFGRRFYLSLSKKS